MSDKVNLYISYFVNPKYTTNKNNEGPSKRTPITGHKHMVKVVTLEEIERSKAIDTIAQYKIMPDIIFRDSRISEPKIISAI